MDIFPQIVDHDSVLCNSDSVDTLATVNHSINLSHNTDHTHHTTFYANNPIKTITDPLHSITMHHHTHHTSFYIDCRLYKPGSWKNWNRSFPDHGPESNTVPPDLEESLKLPDIQGGSTSDNIVAQKIPYDDEKIFYQGIMDKHDPRTVCPFVWSLWNKVELKTEFDGPMTMLTKYINRLQNIDQHKLKEYTGDAHFNDLKGGTLGTKMKLVTIAAMHVDTGINHFKIHMPDTHSWFDCRINYQFPESHELIKKKKLEPPKVLGGAIGDLTNAFGGDKKKTIEGDTNNEETEEKTKMPTVAKMECIPMNKLPREKCGWTDAKRDGENWTGHREICLGSPTDLFQTVVGMLPKFVSKMISNFGFDKTEKHYLGTMGEEFPKDSRGVLVDQATYFL